MKIYVASSWRNEHQPIVVKELLEDGHEVYDFKDAEGFNWTEISENYSLWQADQYIEGLEHQAANRGFKRDMDALEWADCCIMVMPCGLSAGSEMGYAVGAGKLVCVYVPPEFGKPDLMIKMANFITDKLPDLRKRLKPTRDSEK